MRVALFTDTYLPDVNGVSKTLARWVDYLESRHIPVKIFAPDHQERDAGTDGDVVQRLYSIPFILYPQCRLGIPNPIHIKKTLRDFNPTVVHVATPFNIGLYGHHYAVKHGIPLVASYHTHFDQYLAYYKIQWVESVLWKYMHWFHQDCKKIFVPSQSTLEHLIGKGFDAGKMDIWGRGVDLTRFTPHVDREAVLERWGIAKDRFVVLYVGRLAPEKSLHMLFDTYQALPEHIRRRCSFLIAGDGPQYKELLETYEPADYPDVHFLGFQEGRTLSDLYAAADVFFFPSATETFGNVVLEAMASGTPVIGADAGGVRDNVQHGRNGYLCPPGETQAFTDALIRLYEDDWQRVRLGHGAREYASRQTWDQIFSRLLQAYTEVEATAVQGEVDSGMLS
ncbi:glycosyltransferase family 1 protein [Xylanibacillus composti]|uniref:Glycosyl transferase n=1 Tax=Xylanibacillus composti TaxID=1572762 RepID=A0A8J4H4P8_9BACL|nr:glycosyltransferase family 1 protein [Xylanibacillus composti]MDT9724633.1 glycosyltransferase family 1 protein [Xylanibacillus composti]GIQ70918.1 glycosyl transferase [Xylanibacillus composti]